MADAYRYAEGDTGKGTPPTPFEITRLSYIDRFGVQAVIGRPILSAGEMERMIVSENIVNAYNARKRSKEWADWAAKNQGLNRLLTQVEMMLNDNGK